ncbi:MAG: hypothetical protein N4A57_07900 [Anaeromicrobium sp.]|jgi:hypothetical protein|uniref:hypothetical protein n=1 Tax=Anaeromicrobium sp. TaxID=1929132 RepID=UPI0025DB0B0F|nr:hypothetical protein [Anaeromicrobium sp.]MCT4594173.1 hypothetical protein [Anaeromicrobium sp.]
MSDFLTDWFKWFEKGIEGLDQSSKEKIFSECGQNCVKRGVAQMYKRFYRESGRNLDQFFLDLSKNGYGKGYIVEPGKKYEMSFSSCSCELHKQGYVNSDCICECSRQSIIYVMKSIKPDTEIEIEKITTILSGDKECRFRINLNT